MNPYGRYELDMCTRIVALALIRYGGWYQDCWERAVLVAAGDMTALCCNTIDGDHAALQQEGHRKKLKLIWNIEPHRSNIIKYR